MRVGRCKCRGDEEEGEGGGRECARCWGGVVVASNGPCIVARSVERFVVLPVVVQSGTHNNCRCDRGV